MTTITLQPDVAQQVATLASAAATDETEFVDRALRSYLSASQRDQISAEVLAFERLRTELRTRYPDEYVALRGGKVVDHDPDLRTLHVRVNEEFGSLPVLLRHVNTESPREFSVRSPRTESAR
jgi:hypothetical protein